MCKPLFFLELNITLSQSRPLHISTLRVDWRSTDRRVDWSSRQLEIFRSIPDRRHRCKNTPQPRVNEQKKENAWRGWVWRPGAFHRWKVENCKRVGIEPGPSCRESTNYFSLPRCNHGFRCRPHYRRPQKGGAQGRNGEGRLSSRVNGGSNKLRFWKKALATRLNRVALPREKPIDFLHSGAAR